MDITATAPTQATKPEAQASGNHFSALGSKEFFQLIIADLLNQDPLNPTDNQKLLEQIALIREIEASNETSTSLRSLIEQQRFGSASSLIGQFVEGDEATGFASGVVAGVRFDHSGSPILMLTSGTELALSSLQTITSLERLAESLVGQTITANVIEDGEPTEVEGTVMEVKTVSGTIMLELDSGQVVPLASVKKQSVPSL